MQWTTEQRYTRIEDITEQELAALKQKVDRSPWRQTYHIQPEMGLLNDPNGFSFFNGEYHLFYQWFPLGPVHGIKYWYHTKSTDLVHWENAGIAIRPNDDIDSHGAYSGSGIEHNGQLYLMYTGNTRDENWIRHPKQNIAVMDQNGSIQKRKTPVIDHVPDGYTDHFRDPKVWKEHDTFYAIIGAQRTDLTGCVVLYRSPDMETWTFAGEVQTALPEFGYMWECPDYFEINGQGIFIFSPQGIAPDGDHYHNIYQSGYVLGNLDVHTQQLQHSDFNELDRGFDFYAPQTMEAPDGRRILVGWMGLPEMAYPTDDHGWAHCLTIPRELTIENGRLMQRPVRELQNLRGIKMEASALLEDETKTFDSFSGTSFELICTFDLKDADSCGIEIRVNDREKTIITYDAAEQKVHVDRTHSGALADSAYGSVRSCRAEGSRITFHLFVDSSSLELFVNDGLDVFTSRIFPSDDCTGIRFFAKGGRAACRAEKWTIGG